MSVFHSTRDLNRDSSESEYYKLSHGKIKVLKCSRRGKPRDIQLSLSSNQGQYQFVWSSNLLGPKFGKSNKVEIFRMEQILQGQNTAQFNRAPSHIKSMKDRSLSLFYNSDSGEKMSLDMVAHSVEDCEYLLQALNSLITETHSKRAAASPDELYLRDMWNRGDADGSGTLTQSEIISLVASMNISMPSATIRKTFKKFDEDNSGALNYDEFTQFIALLRERQEMRALWKLAIDNQSFSGVLTINEEDQNDEDETLQTISLTRMVEFWQSMQHETVSENEMLELIDKRCPTKVNMENIQISYVMFSSLFTSAQNDLFLPEKEALYQDMTHPLSHYFIASSHNTYLEGDQLMSNSSVQRYIDDMTCGCRCIELDCWDGDKGLPCIYHGHTLTTKILFSDVVDAIRKYGFQTSPYPLILSIENHCSLPQQQKLAQILKEGLKEMLAYPMQGGSLYLPSPESLRGKVLVKGKRIDSADGDDDDEEKDGDDDEPTDTASATASATAATSADTAPEVKHKTHPELSEITYLSTGKVNGFDETGNLSIPCDNMCSFSEGKTFKSLKSIETVNGWIMHNEKHLSRIYPKGTRIDSSNYDPTPAWTAGNQLVALNYQTSDIPMHVNRGKFRENNQCGYVLKPPYMLTPTRPTGRGLKLTVTILSGHQLPKPGAATKGEVIDPFVVVSMHGVAEDEAEARTKTINDNGFNPIWNEKKEFIVKNPEVAVINFEVLDEDVTQNEFIGFLSAPVSCLRAGLRECSLRDAHGLRGRDYAFATISLLIELEQVYLV